VDEVKLMAISLIQYNYAIASWQTSITIPLTFTQGANKKLVVLLSEYYSDIGTVTYNGVPLTESRDFVAQEGYQNTTCYYLDDADFPETAGTYDLVYSSTTNFTLSKMAVWEFHGAKQGLLRRCEYSNGSPPSAQGIVIKNYISPLQEGSYIINECMMSTSNTEVPLEILSGQTDFHVDLEQSSWFGNATHLVQPGEDLIEIVWGFSTSVTSNNRRSFSVNVLDADPPEFKYCLEKVHPTTHITSAEPDNTATASIVAPTADNLLVLYIGVDQEIAGFQPIIGWEMVNEYYSPSNHNNMAVYVKISDGTETSVTVSWGTVREARTYVEEWSGFNGEYTVFDAVANSVGSTAGLTVNSGNTIPVTHKCLGLAIAHGYRTYTRNYGWFNGGFGLSYISPNTGANQQVVLIATANKELEVKSPAEVEDCTFTHYVTSTRYGIALTLLYGADDGPGPEPEPDPDPTPLPANKVLTQVKNVTESTDITLNSNVLAPGDFLSIYRNKSLLQSSDLWPLIQYITAGDLLCFASGGTTVLSSDVIRDITYWFSSVAAYSDTNFNSLWQKKVSKEVVNHIQADIASFDFGGVGVVESEAALLDRLAPVFYYLGNYMCSEAKTTLDALSVGVDADFFNTERKGLYSLLLGSAL
jgi:hypothetical protein